MTVRLARWREGGGGGEEEKVVRKMKVDGGGGVGLFCVCIGERSG